MSIKKIMIVVDNVDESVNLRELVPLIQEVLDVYRDEGCEVDLFEESE